MAKSESVGFSSSCAADSASGTVDAAQIPGISERNEEDDNDDDDDNDYDQHEVTQAKSASKRMDQYRYYLPITLYY